MGSDKQFQVLWCSGVCVFFWARLTGMKWAGLSLKHMMSDTSKHLWGRCSIWIKLCRRLDCLATVSQIWSNQSHTALIRLFLALLNLKVKRCLFRHKQAVESLQDFRFPGVVINMMMLINSVSYCFLGRKSNTDGIKFLSQHICSWKTEEIFISRGLCWRYSVGGLWNGLEIWKMLRFL